MRACAQHQEHHRAPHQVPGQVWVCHQARERVLGGGFRLRLVRLEPARRAWTILVVLVVSGTGAVAQVKPYVPPIRGGLFIR